MQYDDLDLRTALPPRLPRRGERLNDYCVTLTAEEAATMLGYLAMLDKEDLCGRTRCESCQGFRQLWWTLSNALRPSDRDQLHCALAGMGIPLPLYPYEEETT